VTRAPAAGAAGGAGVAGGAGRGGAGAAGGAGPGAPGAAGAGRAAGRRAGDSGTRETILAAARRRFADHGYDAATIRSIAADAAVDPALVHHFFGSKEQLFVAAMQLPFAPGELIQAALAPGARAPGVSAGEQLIRTALRAWDHPTVRSTFLGLLRSALTSEQAARMLREFVSETILGPVARAARAEAQAGAAGSGSGPAGAAGRAGAAGDASGGAGAAGAARAGAGAGEAARAAARDDVDAEYRAGMVASQVLGLAVTRFVLALGPVASASADDLAATIGPTLQRYLTGEIRPASPDGADRPASPDGADRVGRLARTGRIGPTGPGPAGPASG
jgi:AcrR family transcriptional regulator